MGKRILIVDDDDDFRTLLADLYTQADYDVTSMANPLEALSLLTREDFDLCVTDQSMPELKGIDFIDKVREIKPRIPLIMVSAYLNEEVSERLSALRIEVFHKPLNVMSLLRKTADMINTEVVDIENDDIKRSSSQVESHNSGPIAQSNRDFKAFPLLSKVSKQFHQELLTVKNNLNNLVLVGSPGTHFHTICEDVESFQNPDDYHFVFLANKEITPFEISKRISGESTSKTVIVTLYEAFNLEAIHKDILVKLYKKSGPFSGVLNNVKFIFCLHEDLDTQYSKGLLDEDFYLILGQKEIFVPDLKDCPEDIPEMAETIASSFLAAHSEYGNSASFTADATEYLKEESWENQYQSLYNTIINAVILSNGEPITASLLQTAKTKNPPAKIAAQSGADQSAIINKPAAKPKLSPPETGEKADAAPVPSKTATHSPRVVTFKNLIDETELAEQILVKQA